MPIKTSPLKLRVENLDFVLFFRLFFTISASFVLITVSAAEGNGWKSFVSELKV